MKIDLGKAVEWLKEDLRVELDRDGYPSVTSRSCNSVEEFIENFIKAVKEDGGK